jgi:hypothetical protein
MTSNSWKKIWSEREEYSQLNGNDQSKIIDKLLALDGFDSPTGFIKNKSWINYIDDLKSNYSILNTDSIFEVGCGAGAFLYPFYLSSQSVGGVDYSKTLINSCNKLMPDGKFAWNEAKNLDVEEKYDFIVSFSVFFYFPSYEYAELTLKKMYDKSRKGIMILDVPNLSTQDICEKNRRGVLSEKEYEKKYKNLNHLYYDKNFFINFAKNNPCKFYEIKEQKIEKYVNNDFRFNFVMLKK